MDNDFVLCDLHQPSITSISRNDYEVGRQAAQLLFRMIHCADWLKAPNFIPPDRLILRLSQPVEISS